MREHFSQSERKKNNRKESWESLPASVEAANTATSASPSSASTPTAVDGSGAEGAEAGVVAGGKF
jgi:hypothetical protein